MAHQSYGGWQVWIRGQATHCLRRGLSVVAEAWERDRRVGKSRLVPEELALLSGRFEGAMRLAAMGDCGGE